MAVSGTSGLYYDNDDMSDVSGYTKSMSEYGTGPYSKGNYKLFCFFKRNNSF